MVQRRSLFFLVLAVALLVRVTGLDRFPPGLWFDEGLKGVDAWRTLHGGGFLLIYPDVFPREPLFVWILAIVEWFAGPKVLPLRLMVAFLGALTCGLLFLMVGSVERKSGMVFALAAAFVMAASHWNAHFSRLLFRTNLVPLVSILAVLAISGAARASGSKTRKALAWLGAGAMAGVGFYTYLSWWFFLPVLAVWFWALSEPADQVAEAQLLPSPPLPTPWRCLLFLAGAALVFLPLGIHYLHHPEHLLGRPGEISPFRNGLGEGLRMVGRNALFVAEMFSYRGDHVPKHNVPWTPVLDIVWSAFFYLGIVGAILGLRKRGSARRSSLAGLAWLFFMSLPSIISKTDSANMLRNLGATPAVAYFVASGWWQCMGLAKRVGPKRSELLRWALVALLVWGAGFQVYKLWVRHPKAEGIQGNFSVQYVAMAELCRPDPAGALLFVPTDIYAHKTFEFLTIGRKDILPMDLGKLVSRSTGSEARPGIPDHRVLCTMWSASAQNPQGNYGILQAWFPEGTPEKEKVTMGDRPFALIFRVPGNLLFPDDRAEQEAEKIRQAGFFIDR